MSSNQIILVAICGKGATGKDTLSEKLCFDLANKSVPVHRVLRTTTRPQRINEYTNPPYRFITNNAFSIEKNRGWFVENSTYRGWSYGTQLTELKSGKINVGTFDIKALRQLKESKKIDELVVVYLQEPFKTRLKRYKDRTGRSTFEMYRRIASDAVNYAFVDLQLEGFNCLKMTPGRGVLHKSNAVQDFLKDNLLI